MIVTHRLYRTDTENCWQVVAIFGVGLIGRAVLRSLELRAEFALHALPFSWVRCDQRADDSRVLLEAIQAKVSGFLQVGCTLPVGRFDVLWSAGAGGFGMSRRQLLTELQSFRDVLEITEELCTRYPWSRHCFHMLSSAGGLFEGQRNVNCESIPHPKRPYGELKLKQEDLLSTLPDCVSILVYRPSSVYGFSEAGDRLGLISALIQNGIRQRVSQVYGDLHTLRDYVFARDIGAFIAGKIIGEAGSNEILTLVAAKPSAIVEVVNIIESILDRHLYVHFNPDSNNSAHNSYVDSIRPQAWMPTSLDTGIRLTYHQLGALFGRSPRI